MVLEPVAHHGSIFRVRELLIRQRTQAISALRGHLTEFGQIVPQGAANAAKLIAIVEEPASGLPADAVGTLKVLVAALTHLEAEIGRLDAEIVRRAKANDMAWRLMMRCVGGKIGFDLSRGGRPGRSCCVERRQMGAPTGADRADDARQKKSLLRNPVLAPHRGWLMARVERHLR